MWAVMRNKLLTWNGFSLSYMDHLVYRYPMISFFFSFIQQNIKMISQMMIMFIININISLLVIGLVFTFQVIEVHVMIFIFHYLNSHYIFCLYWHTFLLDRSASWWWLVGKSPDALKGCHLFSFYKCVDLQIIFYFLGS